MKANYSVEGLFFRDRKGCGAEVLIIPPIEPRELADSIVSHIQPARGFLIGGVAASHQRSTKYTTITLRGVHGRGCLSRKVDSHAGDVVEQALGLVIKAMLAKSLSVEKR